MTENASKYAEFIKTIAKTMDECDLVNIHISENKAPNEHISFSLSKSGSYGGVSYIGGAPYSQITADGAAMTSSEDVSGAGTSSSSSSASFTPSTSGAAEVKSPMVGVFYSAPSPESDPFVHIGNTVKKGDVLCILEAMKLMNEIQAEQDGEIVDICAKNGDVVEFGQVLFKIK